MNNVLQEAIARFASGWSAPENVAPQRFAVLPSRQAPRCLLPVGDRRSTLAGFRVYTPYAFRARVLKGLLSQVVKTGWSGWAVNSLYVREPLGLKALVASVTGERSPVFSLLLGTPGRYRKLTIQVMRPDGETLGFVKLALTDASVRRVRREARVLERLAGGRMRVPRVLYSGEWQDSYLLFQSPLDGRPGPTKLSGMHVEFLEELAAVHRVDKPGVRVVDEVGARWNEVACRCDWAWQRLGTAALAEARRALDGVMVPCGPSHGDFAPWNTRVQNGQLAALDWESCEWEAPLGWDALHFSVQVASLLKKRWRTKFDQSASAGPRGLFLLYLLASLGEQLDEEADSSDGIEYRRRALGHELGLHQEAHARR